MAATKREWYIVGDNTSTSPRANYWKAQTFTIGTVGVNENFSITSVKIKGYKAGSPSTLYFAIKAVDEEYKPTGPDLSTGSIDPSGWGGSPGAWYEISMSAYTLLASTQYALVLKSPDSSTDNQPYWRANNSGTYAGGSYISSSNSGVDWTIYDAYDLMFEIWGQPPGVDETVYPATFELALTQHAPGISIDCTVLAETLELAATLHPPAVVIDRTVTPATFELAAALLAPEVWIGVVVTPDTFALALTQHAPSLRLDYTVQLDSALQLGLALHAPTVFPIVTVSPESLALAVALLSPVVVIDVTVTPDTFALALTQHAPVVSVEVIVFPAIFELEATLHAPETISHYTAIPSFMQKDLIDPYSGGAWLWLCEIAVPGYGTQNIARNTEDIRHAGKDYNRWNLDIGKQTFAGDGSIPRVTLRIAQDPARTFEKIVNASKGCHDGTVKLIRVNEKFLDYRVTALEADYNILVADSDWEWVYFTLGIPNLLTQRIPLRVGSSKICPWAVPEYFKGVRCRYTGSDVSCTGKLNDCYAKGNAQHWGGEVGLDPNVTRV